jgi:hypothetical protein
MIFKRLKVAKLPFAANTIVNLVGVIKVSDVYKVRLFLISQNVTSDCIFR